MSVWLHPKADPQKNPTLHFVCRQSVFFFSKFCEEVGPGHNNSQEDLANFGYKSRRKVEKFGNCAIFWRHARSLSELFCGEFSPFQSNILKK